jgi:hypothetical protein
MQGATSTWCMNGRDLTAPVHLFGRAMCSWHSSAAGQRQVPQVLRLLRRHGAQAVTHNLQPACGPDLQPGTSAIHHTRHHKNLIASCTDRGDQCHVGGAL